MKILREKALKYAETYGAKTIISLLPLHIDSFGTPTATKEKAVKEVFPNVSLEKIHHWLSLGNMKRCEIADDALIELEKTFRLKEESE